MSLEIVRASFFLSVFYLSLFTFRLRRQTFLIAFEEKKFGGMRLTMFMYLCSKKALSCFQFLKGAKGKRKIKCA